MDDTHPDRRRCSRSFQTAYANALGVRCPERLKSLLRTFSRRCSSGFQTASASAVAVHCPERLKSLLRTFSRRCCGVRVGAETCDAPRKVRRTDSSRLGATGISVLEGRRPGADRQSRPSRRGGVPVFNRPDWKPCDTRSSVSPLTGGSLHLPPGT